MKLNLDIRPAADADIVEIAAHLSENNPEAARDFLAALQRSTELLTVMPGVGPEYPFLDKRLTGIQKWAVEGYRHYLIFYRVQPESVQVIRVVHGARDIPRILSEEP